MDLFEDEPTVVCDWFDACPNSQDILLEEKKIGLFDAMRLWTGEYDRMLVKDALGKAKTSGLFMLDVMNATMPYDPTVMFVGRELLMKDKDDISLSILALSKTGTERKRIKFPSKRSKAVPNRLLAVFGLRPSEAGWFDKITAREENVLAVVPHLIEKDWEYIIHDKGTLLKKSSKKATAPMNLSNWGLNV
jgi:hypothetical protein